MVCRSGTRSEMLSRDSEAGSWLLGRAETSYTQSGRLLDTMHIPTWTAFTRDLWTVGSGLSHQSDIFTFSTQQKIVCFRCILTIHNKCGLGEGAAWLERARGKKKDDQLLPDYEVCYSHTSTVDVLLVCSRLKDLLMTENSVNVIPANDEFFCTFWS